MPSKDRITRGLSFDDVLLRPSRSDVLPRDVNLSTRLTRKLNLNIPLLSAAMDTVTESRLAIALAQEGGIGIIHKNLSIEDQAAEIDRVKRSQSGIITDPFTLRAENSLQDAENMMARYHVSGVPITDATGTLVGILTNRDMRFEEDYGKPISTAMTPQERLVTVAPGTSLDEAKKLLHKHRIEKLPIVDDAGKLKGLLTIKDIKKARDFPQRCVDDLGRLRVGAALGVGETEVPRAEALLKAGADVLVVDSAHGHSAMVAQTVRALKAAFPDAQIIAGNIVTAEGAADLIDAGVDAVKIGVGPGAICTTRVVAGVGVPQLTAVMDVSEECGKHDVPVIADGGIKYSGDIAKAIAGGADTVMIGSLFAGSEEAPGSPVIRDGQKVKVVRGMASLGAAMARRLAEQEQDESAESQVDWDKVVPEGVEAVVPYRGNVKEIVYQLVGGLRSGLSYGGARTIAELQEHAEFIEISAAGVRESNSHDVRRL